MSRRATGKKQIVAMTVAIALAATAPCARAQILDQGVFLVGPFYEANFSLPLSSPEGGYRAGGALRAGFELAGLPGSPWQFDLAGRYETIPAGPDRNQAFLGGELRVGYALTVSALVDFSPFVAFGLGSDLTTGGLAFLPSVGCKLNFYLGSWGYLSLVPEFAYPFGTSAAPTFGLGLGFKQLQAWDLGRPNSRVSPEATPADMLAIQDGARYRMRIPNIIFPANSANLSKASADEFMKGNYQLLNRLVEILKRFPDYRITIVGHANLIDWADPSLAAAEDRDVSLPLSLERAEAVKAAFVRLGIRADTISVEGRGSHEPLVPFGDKKNNWKNRRVEVFLDR